jgi:hypothetical protein
LSFLLCLRLLFNKISDKGRTGFAWKQGLVAGKGGAGGRKDPNNVYTCKYTNNLKKKGILGIF